LHLHFVPNPLHPTVCAQSSAPHSVCPIHCTPQCVPNPLHPTVYPIRCTPQCVPNPLHPTVCAQSTAPHSVCPIHCTPQCVLNPLHPTVCAQSTAPHSVCPIHCTPQCVPLQLLWQNSKEHTRKHKDGSTGSRHTPANYTHPQTSRHLAPQCTQFPAEFPPPAPHSVALQFFWRRTASHTTRHRDRNKQPATVNTPGGHTTCPAHPAHPEPFLLAVPQQPCANPLRPDVWPSCTTAAGSVLRPHTRLQGGGQQE
jgi:hypothetical protein